MKCSCFLSQRLHDGAVIPGGLSLSYIRQIFGVRGYDLICTLMLSYETLIVKQEYKKVATLENEIEARLLDSVLAERNIPHLIQSFHDTAYDGLYQTQRGWGCIRAPEAYFEEIDEIITSVRHKSGLPGGSS